MRLIRFLIISLLCSAGTLTYAADELQSAFHNPARQAKMHCYWWWLNGNTDEATITRDLTEMADKGYGGAILIDANGSNQFGNEMVPPGPTYGSPAWQKLYLHALREAARLNLEISLTIQSGWNLGGPTVTTEQSSKLLTWSRRVVHGPGPVSLALPQPKTNNGFYRDVALLAYPLHAATTLAGEPGDRRPAIRQLAVKAASAEFGRSMPDTAPLLTDVPGVPDETDAALNEVMNLTGRTEWRPGPGNWEILRLGYTASGALVSTSSGAWQGLAIDHMDHTAFDSYWHTNIDPLLTAARPYLGKSLRYLVTDSWELGGTNWTGRFREEFQRRRGYDPLPYLPVITGRILGSRDISNRFLFDFRKTVGDLIRDEHYAVFAAHAQQYGLGIHPESGGPHGTPIDALQTLGLSTFPQTEYWAKSATHRSTDADRFFVKEAASAGHTYGKTLVAAEGMTSIGPQWEEVIWNDLRPSFDQAVCSGLNLLFWHTFTSAPPQFGLPGREYFAGSHLNPNVTWWSYAKPFIAYINRVQAVMQQGLPSSDVLYYYGDRVPNFVQLPTTDPAHAHPGYDYDAVDEKVLLSARAEGHSIRLPSGTRYRVLAIGDTAEMSLAALQKVADLSAAGISIVGRKPERTGGLPVQDSTFVRLAGTLHPVASSLEALRTLGVPPDFEGDGFEFIHRITPDSDIYFVRSESAEPQTKTLTFRLTQLQPAHAHPELWHADSGVIEASVYSEPTPDGRIQVPLSFEPYGSQIIVFRPGHRSVSKQIDHGPDRLFPVSGPWQLQFPHSQIDLTKLVSWPDLTNPSQRYFSGTATYRTNLDIPAEAVGPGLTLDLGEVHELAQVTLNGHDLGVVWKKPFRISIAGAAHAGRNQLSINVVNLWPNRLIGDQNLPSEQRQTRTNITKFRADSPLLPSGLLGPVQLRAPNR